MSDSNSEQEVLVVTSKLKKYIRSSAGISTSANVAPALSDIIRSLCDQAVENAKADKRKTVMDRDFS
jgi:histone H3/H4